MLPREEVSVLFWRRRKLKLERRLGSGFEARSAEGWRSWGGAGEEDGADIATIERGDK
jgi:hypothetical protein